MHISRKNLKIRTPYHLDGQQLEQVSRITDLGITVSSYLSWSRHIELRTAKANKTLGLMKRICRDINDFATKRLLYCDLVRPKLEHRRSIWSPDTVKHRSLIENIQRRATKFILNYRKETPCTERLMKTNLLPLEFRRKISDLLLVFKSMVPTIICAPTSLAICLAFLWLSIIICAPTNLAICLAITMKIISTLS